MSPTEAYKQMSDADKAALKQLQDEVASRLSVKVSLSDMIAAVTPGMKTPEYLQNC